MRKRRMAALIMGAVITLCCGCTDSKSEIIETGDYSDIVGVFSNNDIAEAIQKVSDDNTIVLDTAVIDLDYDGTDELLVLSSWGKNEIHLFCKSGDQIIEKYAFGMGMLNYIDKLEFIPCFDKENQIYCFEFHYDNGGVMTADVVAGIMKNENSGEFEIHYLLSKGILNYSNLEHQTKKEFYRIGWNQFDVALDKDYNDISKEKYMELYSGLFDGLK